MVRPDAARGRRARHPGAPVSRRALRPGDRVHVLDRDVVAVVEEPLGRGQYLVTTASSYDSGAYLVRRRAQLVLA